MEKNKRIGQREIGLLCDTPPLLGLSLMRSRPREEEARRNELLMAPQFVSLSSMYTQRQQRQQQPHEHGLEKRKGPRGGREAVCLWVGAFLPAQQRKKKKKKRIIKDERQ